MTGKKKYRAGLEIALRYLIAAGVIAWLWKTDLIDVRVFGRLDSGTLIAGIALMLIQSFLTGWRIQLLLAEHGINVGIYRCIAYNSIGILYSIFLPGGMSGDIARAYCFWRAYPTYAKSSLFGALFVDRFIGTVTLLSIGVVAATFVMNSFGLERFVLIAWCGLLLILAFYFIAIQSSRYKEAYKSSLMIKLLNFFEKISHQQYSNKILIICLLIGLAGHFCTILLIYACSTLMDSDLDLLKVIAVAPIGLLANALPITPGGLGVGEQVFDILYKLTGGTAGANSFLLARIFLSSPALLGVAIIIYRFITSHYQFIAKRGNK